MIHSSRKHSTYFVTILTLIVFIVEATAARGADEANSSTCCPCPSPLSSLLSHYMTVLLRTVEVALRGFLLGFGLTVLKDLLVDGKRGDDDRSAAYRYGTSVGLGMACALVGASVVIPARLQAWVMDTDEYH